MIQKTIFEKIVDQEIPADIIYQDPISMAFLDINPVSKGHTLVITKKPYPWMVDVPDQELAHIFLISKKIMQALQKTINCDFVQIVVLGVDVPHFHVHLIPRFIKKDQNQSSFNIDQRDLYSNNKEKQIYKEKIINALKN